MEREEGVIQQLLNNNKALVNVQKSSHCSTCQSRGSCHVMDGRDTLIEVDNDLHAKVGDRVEITVPTTTLLKLSILVYFVPILALLVGAYLGAAWASSFQLEATLASVLGGALAMGATFYGLKRLDRRLRGKPEFTPRMRRILFSAASLQSGDSK